MKKRNCFFNFLLLGGRIFKNQLLPVVIYRFWALVFNLTRPMDGWIYAICLACPFYTICVSMSILLFRDPGSRNRCCWMCRHLCASFCSTPRKWEEFVLAIRPVTPSRSSLHEGPRRRTNPPRNK